MGGSSILMPHRLGEFVCALSVVTRKAAESNEAFTLIVHHNLVPLCSLLTNLPYFPYRRGSTKELVDSLRGIKGFNFDKIYVLTNSLSTAWFASQTGIPVRQGISSSLLNPFFTRKISPDKEKNHFTKKYAEILEIPHIGPELWPGMPVAPDLEYKNFIAICPGPGQVPTKQWKGFRELIKLMPGYEFVILGDEHDIENANKIASHFPHRVKNYAGKTTLNKAASILSAASVVISTHCGLMHLAGFLGVPVVGIFGSTSQIVHSPLGAAVRCAVTSASCKECEKTECRRKDYICMDTISVEEVISLAGEIIRHC